MQNPLAEKDNPALGIILICSQHMNANNSSFNRAYLQD